MIKLAIAVALLVSGCAAFDLNAGEIVRLQAMRAPGEDNIPVATVHRGDPGYGGGGGRRMTAAILGGVSDGLGAAANVPRRRQMTCQRDPGVSSYPTMTCREN